MNLSHMLTMKPYLMNRTLAPLGIAVVLMAMLTLAHTAFGGGGGGGGGSSSSGGSVSFTSNTPSGTTGTYTSPNGTRTSFSTNCGGCAVGGGNMGPGSGGGGGGGNNNMFTGGGNTNTPPPPQPIACSIRLDRSVVEVGTSTIRLSWSPTPAGSVQLVRTGDGSRRGTTLRPSNGATSFTDTLATTRVGTVMYSLTFSRSISTTTGRTLGAPAGYACSVPLRVVTRITECNDGVDNADSEDGLIDQQDPGCHTDGDPRNTGSYDQNDGTEANPPADMKPSITAVEGTTARRPVAVTASALNDSGTYAGSNSLVYGWRDTSSAAAAPNCGRRGSLCFVEDGKTFLRLATYTRTYAANQRRTDAVQYFRPSVRGQYEVCAIADFDNEIAEGAAGEANNSTCRTIQVVETATPPAATSTITGPVTLDTAPSRVRAGNPSSLSWNTGGRIECVLTGTNGESIAITTTTGTSPTRAITGATTYTLACTDPGYEDSDTAIVNILPNIQEI